MKPLVTTTVDFASLATDAQRFMYETVDENPWVVKTPHPRQRAFLACPLEEVLFGGAAGGAKTVALLMAAAQFVETPGYNALLLRRTLPMLELPGGLIDESKNWWMNTPAKWNEQKKHWTFPSGATIHFGYLDNYNDVFRYQGSEWDFIAFDELTQFEEPMYRYLFSRQRRLEGSEVLPRTRATSNPGGIGHDWVKNRFIVGRNAHFIPSRLEDNPSLDRREYETKLAKLDPVTRAQLRYGNWDVRPEGNLFKRHWLRAINRLPGQVRRTIRFWDLAATETGTSSEDPDYTVGARVSKLGDDTYVVSDVIRLRGSPGTVQQIVKTTARRDGVDVAIRMEQEGGSSGKSLVNVYAKMLDGYDFRGVASRRDKVTRAQAFSAAVERGDVVYVEGEWNGEFLDELCAFPAVNHDDQVDAVVGAYNALARAAEPWTAENVKRAFDEADADEFEMVDAR